MGLMFLKKITFLFLLISASFLSTSFAGRRFTNNLAKEVDGSDEEISSNGARDKEMNIIHERLLKVNTKDYGNYDPAPSLVRPPFKVIQN
ncbi:protein CASPARIAN STRIP INTEGRITY FACTOR 1-like [Tripterygium wilfordii]|uniref:protein CASPARIAN STRIP INTEGRITY FACTOR 1-like n=1 Tax=Tripterygium wilfordii TaxID=458696 RepID=UPI0018F85313|nr:protein CASPARIAN STRIP INTEGRITY FACTOR 1-like [Tripterygium wilfordii]